MVSRLLALVAVAACVVPLACGGDDDDADDPPRTSAPAAPTTTSPESEVESAYLAYWDTVARLYSEPDPDSPEISKVATDPARSTLVQTLEDLSTARHSIELGPDYAHRVSEISVDADSARLSDCTVDDASLVDGSGVVLREATVTTALNVDLVRVGQAWRVREIHPIQDWEGATTCDA